jgi:hypothetical protein
LLYTEDDYFPCSPDQVHNLIARDPVTDKESILYSTLDPYDAPYDWAICHTGTWINRQHRYIWVAGTKRHHRCPVRWIKNGHDTGYVPLHPHDVVGKPPINLKYGVFCLTGRKGKSVERLAYDPGHPAKLLDSPPKDFRKPYLHTLAHVEAPKAEARMLREPNAGGKDVAFSKDRIAALTFDHRSQSFMLTRQVTQGSRTSTVVAPLGGRNGTLQAHSRGGSFGGGNRGGGSGSFSHASSGGGGGGFHGGGGGGGGGHSGGGGGGGHK